MESSGTAPVLKAGLPSSAAASGAILGPGINISERGTSTRSNFDPHGHGTMSNQTTKRRKKKKGLKKKTREGDPKAVETCTPVPAKRSHSDGSTPRDSK